ncbi:HAMP domain-containing protein [Sphingomonas sp. MMS24-JH45]
MAGLKLADGSWLYFRTLEPVAAINLAFERVMLAMVPAIALMVLGAAALRQLLLPLRRLATAATHVGHGEVVPLAEEGPGEVRRVITAFNVMQERIGSLIAGRTQALAAVGHDLRTPLARLHLRTNCCRPSRCARRCCTTWPRWRR